MPRAIIVVACLAAVGLADSDAKADKGKADRDEPPTLSVSGTGKISAAPDVAEINLGVVSHAPTARDALAANNEAMSALMATLKQHGVAAKDVRTSQIQINPQYSQPRPVQPGAPPQQNEFVPRIVGYRVANMVHVTARDIGKLGTILDAVVQAGANEINGISMRVDEPEKLLDEARKRAMADAKRKAEILAGEAGVVVGPPRSISESGGAMPPPIQPMYGRGVTAMAAPSMPVSAGEQELTVSVSVVYELQLPK